MQNKSMGPPPLKVTPPWLRRWQVAVPELAVVPERPRHLLDDARLGLAEARVGTHEAGPVCKRECKSHDIRTEASAHTRFGGEVLISGSVSRKWRDTKQKQVQSTHVFEVIIRQVLRVRQRQIVIQGHRGGPRRARVDIRLRVDLPDVHLVDGERDVKTRGDLRAEMLAVHDRERGVIRVAREVAPQFGTVVVRPPVPGLEQRLHFKNLTYVCVVPATPLK